MVSLADNYDCNIIQNAVQDDVSYSEAAKTGVEFTCADEITDEEASSIVSD